MSGNALDKLGVLKLVDEKGKWSAERKPADSIHLSGSIFRPP